MDLDHLSVADLGRGYAREEGGWRCLRCGMRFAEGEIFPLDGRLFEAAYAVQRHMALQHPDYRESLPDSDTKYNPLTEHQRGLMALFAQGLSDKEIARQLGVTPSTVRHQKFQFRERAKQARLYLAIYESVLGGEKGGGAIMPIHEHARMVDQRYVVTEEERAHILQVSFASLQPLRLRQFSPREKKKLVVLARIAEEFQPGRDYTEREVNDILRPIFDDFATLRRYLIAYGFMERNPDGSVYRRTERA